MIFLGFLKQSTAVIVQVGQLVDATDGFTPETAIALAAGEADLYKHGVAAVSTDISGNTLAHIGDGVYALTLTAGNTDTLGMLSVVISDTAHRPFRAAWMVMPANVWDSLFGADYLQVDVEQVDGNAGAATNLSLGARGLVSFTVSTGSSNTKITSDLTEATNDHYNGRTVTFLTGALAGQQTSISDYNGTTKEMTVPTMTDTPANGDIAVIS